MATIMSQSSHHNFALATLLAQRRPATAKVARIAREILIPSLRKDLRGGKMLVEDVLTNDFFLLAR